MCYPGIHRTAPRRPYANLEVFRSAHSVRPFSPATFWPCLGCRGNGTIYDPNDPPCPVDGDKWRNRITCPDCGGNGRGTRAACLQAYRATIEKWRQEIEEYKVLIKAKTEALQILTDEQVKALRELGL
jgi:hypothetical protein